MYTWNIIRLSWVYYVIFRNILLTNFNIYRLLLWKMLVFISTSLFSIIFCIAKRFLLYDTMVKKITESILKSSSAVVWENVNYFPKNRKFLKEKNWINTNALQWCWDLFNLYSSLKPWIVSNCFQYPIAKSTYLLFVTFYGI